MIASKITMVLNSVIKMMFVHVFEPSGFGFLVLLVVWGVVGVGLVGVVFVVVVGGGEVGEFVNGDCLCVALSTCFSIESVDEVW